MSAIISLTDAKKNFSSLIDRVEKGEVFIIAKHGREVARLEPVQPPRKSQREVMAAIERFRKLRDQNILNPPGAKERLTIKGLINEGRKR